jgi:ankyrin repeat protein
LERSWKGDDKTLKSRIWGVPALAAALLFMPAACSSPAKKAQEELARRNIAFSEAGFFEQIRSGQTEAVGLFLAAGMSPDFRDRGYTPLLEAARRGYEEMAGALIAAGADVDATDPYGVTALMFSFISGSAGTARPLIEAGTDVNARDVDGRTALIESLTTENDIPDELIALLIEKGANVNVRIANGLTPLMIAVSGPPRIVRLLIEAGADIQARDDGGMSVLRMAEESPENAAILEAAGAKK